MYGRVTRAAAYIDSSQRGALPGGPAAVDGDDLAGDVRGRVGGEPRDDAAEVVLRAHPAQRGQALVALDECLVLPARDAAGGERVDPHLGGEHGREVARQLRDAALARRVGRRVAHPGPRVETHVRADEPVDAR